ncbi:type II restriction endonuclease subunit M [Bacteroides intestinalis]|uniref:site-specific DNA-methyltransferase (adenine-specific) n=1 Tax=Bacteroides intestinalis TaxID=329854 RepID=A0A414L6E6_9BACE|nr:type II restriction endonuclease subunit M [Bacteroides intestinalis]RHE90359.1 type II restriction endonuclease subunit M [Bacteroides intestinalis]
MVADNIKYRFIQNIGDYFPSGYFSEDFIDKVQKASGLDSEKMNALCPPFVSLRGEYEKYKNYIVNTNPRVKDTIRHTHDFHTRLLTILGYSTDKPYDRFYPVDEEYNSVVPVRHILTKNGRTTMFVMEMQPLIKVDDNEPAGLFEQQYNVEIDGNMTEQTIRHQQYYAGQWSEVFTLPEEQRISPAVINKAIDALFLLPEERRPHFILMMAGNTLFLLDSEKWNRGAYLEFSLDELFSQASISAFRKYYALFHLLTCKNTLASDSETVLMDTLVEDSYKNAYEVTKDLKEGVVLAVETLANEALYYKQYIAHEAFGKKVEKEDGTVVYDETDDNFESEVKDDCLTIIYRLLFIFYAESRSELEILPTGDDVYKRGYSLEMLRDLEQTRLNSQQSCDGYFFDDSIQHLFRLLSSGYNKADTMINNKSFRIRPIDSPLFDNKRLNHLGNVRIRNCKWKKIICALSLSKKNSRFGRGRISYANLGVNQLGSVYESLLAFRGFYAEEDYIEVHKAGKTEEGTFLVPYSRMDDFESDEIGCDDDGRPKIIPRGTFVYRLNGRDRQKSASYYTPEVLTRSTVKYTLKSIIDEVAAGKRKATELLELKILEPAMGAAAFQNEVINQLSEAYLTYQQQQQRERGLHNWRISPDRYRDELQKVKAFIATHNVYGVDLNPTAIELGKLSLWLNVIHKDMETPFFANRLTVGNAVIGAWLKVYNKDEVYGIKGRNNKLEQNKWWERAPHRIKFYSNRVNRSINEVYHFLLPDNNMLGVRSITEQKKANKEAYDRMTTILKSWTASINAADFATLQRISAKIDVLLKDYFTAQISIDKYTNNRKEIWDGIDHAESDSIFKEEERMESYARKQQLFDTRYGHDNAYHKLKLVMDYWCALWFWEYKDAGDLPTREEYWGDIEALLAVDNSKIDSRTQQALERAGASSLFDHEDDFSRISEDDAQIVLKTQKEILTEAHANISLFANEEPLRLQIVERLAERYHFFHPMLEFIEVFWLRDGFDVICGNPPWLKYTFKDEDIFQEKYPEVVIHKHTSNLPSKEIMLAANQQMNLYYYSEQTEVACSSIFMNAFCNYPLLLGQQTNLYKCILENSLCLMSDNGYMGILHPETIYDEPNGQPLRKVIYRHLKYHFRFRNSLLLFAEIKDQKQYSINVYIGKDKEPEFDCIFKLYHPSTIDSSYISDGSEPCNGVKIETPKGLAWNLKGHKKRIIHIDSNALLTLAKVFEDSKEWKSAKLGAMYVEDVISVLEKLSMFKTSVKHYENYISEGFHSTNDVNTENVKNRVLNNTIKETDVDKYEMVYSGPNIYVGTAFYKSPRIGGYKKSDFDVVDLTKIDEDYMIRTRFVPNINLNLFKNSFSAFSKEESWQDYYKVGFRKMLNQTGDRTLNAGILINKSSHVNGVISVTFREEEKVIELAGLASSLVLDFLMKTIASANLTDSRLKEFPLGVDKKYKTALFSRTLRLNCLTNHYSKLWECHYNKTFNEEKWSIDDNRLSQFDHLTSHWTKDIPLRNDFERRMALIEIDVISAMAIGITLDELITIYENQFDVLKKNEDMTFYDISGRIVYTKNAGLTGVGIDTRDWENICEFQKGETYLHTINKNSLYNGKTVLYKAPFKTCDRIADYRRAWTHFEKRFNNAKL